MGAKPDNQSSRRLLELFVRMLHGERFDQDGWLAMESNPAASSNKKPRSNREESLNERTKRVFTRDMSIIRVTLENIHDGHILEKDKIDGKLTYWLDGQANPDGLKYDIGLGQILLGSRAFPEQEKNDILEFLGSNLALAAKHEYELAIHAAKNSYQPLSEPRSVLDYLTKLARAINDEALLTFHYRNATDQKIRAYHGQPIILYFETHYFYVQMMLENHQDLVVFRLDRMTSIDFVASGDKGYVNDRHSLQDHRKYVNLLPMGRLTTFKFKCWIAPQTVLDQFPTAKKIANIENSGSLFQVTAKEEGALLWLQSQGPNVKIISPLSLVNKMQERLAQTVALYD